MDSGQNYLQNNNNQLVMKGDFGYISHDSTIFSSYEIAFKSPSEHSVGNSQTFFPLEMQVKFVSASQTKLNMAFLFSFGAESDFLNRLGFGRGIMRNLQQNQNFQIPNSFNLQQILPNKNKFFVYKGSDTNPPCEPTIWLIGYDTLKLNQAQLNDFPLALSYQGRDIQKTKQEIFINFNIEKEQEKKEEEEEEKQGEASTTKTTTTESKTDELHSSQQAMNENYSQEEVNQLNKVKDSFILLGDNTIYDPFVYGHNAEPSAKYIKDTDYIVIQKDKPKDLQKMKKEQEIEQIIFEKLSDDQKELEELNDIQSKKNKKSEQESSSKKAQSENKDSEQTQFILKKQTVDDSNVDKSEDNDDEQKNDKSEQKSDENELQKNNIKNYNEDNEQKGIEDNEQKGNEDDDMKQKEELIDRLKKEGGGSHTKNNKQKNDDPEKYAFDSNGKWDKVPIFSIDEWPELCKSGKNQSPINIDSHSLMIQEDGEINVYYDQLNQHPWLFNDGIKLTLAGKFGTIEFQDHLYDATHVHIHFPSEHTFGEDNKRADIEFQIEHVSIYGNKLMVSILGNISQHETNPFLESIGISGTVLNKHEQIESSLQLEESLVSLDLLADSLEDYYRYEGSLTHPPCTENVIWIVSRDNVQVNKLQIENLRSLLGLKQNVRGTHDLNGRQLFVRQQ